MNTIRFFIAFSLIIGAMSVQGMEVAFQNVQVKNDTDGNIYITFISSENLSRIKPDEKPNQLESEVLIDVTNQSRYTRGLRPRGIFNIKNFTDQDSLYAAFEPNMPLSQSKRLDEEPVFRHLFKEQGTKIIDVKEKLESKTYYGVPYGTVTVFSPTYRVVKEPLEDLIQLEKGAKVKKEEHVYEEAAEKYKTIAERQAVLGKWLNVYENLLNNDAIKTITDQDVYHALGFGPHEAPTPAQILGINPAQDITSQLKDKFKIFAFFLFPDRYSKPSEERKRNKAETISKIINNTIDKLREEHQLGR